MSEPVTAVQWLDITRRNARAVQSLIGWIFWDPGAVSRFEELGLNGPLGYIASRSAPFAGAGPAAVTAAWGSISPVGIELVFQHLASPQAFLPFWQARNAAIVDGLAAHAPPAAQGLREFASVLWSVVEQLPTVGRPFFASHLNFEESTSAILSGWHAVNCLREWRGDTHWAVVTGQGLSAPEASVLHNGWLGYEGDWLSKSRGNSEESIDGAWRALERKRLANNRSLLPEGYSLRQWIEDETDRITTTPWELLGEADSRRFAELFEPPCELLLARVDLTAGVNFQPASRVRPPWRP